MPPAQKVVGPPAVIVGVGSGLTVTFTDADVVPHPASLRALTQYEPGCVTVIDWVVAPFDHWYDGAEDDVSVTDPPAQNVVGPDAVITGTGGGSLTTMARVFDVLAQPLEFVTVTLYDPEVLTLMYCSVEPFDHRYDADTGAPSRTLSPRQNVVGPHVEMCGVSGTGFTVTLTGDEIVGQPPEFVTITV